MHTLPMLLCGPEIAIWWRVQVYTKRCIKARDGDWSNSYRSWKTRKTLGCTQNGASFHAGLIDNIFPQNNFLTAWTNWRSNIIEVRLHFLSFTTLCRVILQWLVRAHELLNVAWDRNENKGRLLLASYSWRLLASNLFKTMAEMKSVS